MPTIYRKARRIINKGVKFVKKQAVKRYAPKGKINFNKIAKDVKYLKTVLNPEKKYFIQTVTSASVAQQNGGVNTGWNANDITPLPISGPGFGERNGSSIKLHSMSIEFQFTQQTNTINGMRINILILQTIGEAQTIASGAVNELFDVNPFSTFTDLNALRNMDHMKNIKIIRSMNVYLKADALATARSTKTGALRLNFGQSGHHIKFGGNTTTVANGQLWVLFRGENGDKGAALTGADLKYQIRSWYFDN